MPSIKSNSISGILLLFLWVSFGLTVISGLFTGLSIYAFDLYKDWVIADNYLTTTNLFLYYMEIVVYLIWLFQLHRELKYYFDFYPISPWGAIFRMLPVINLWGLGDTFNSIGRFMKRYDESLGRRINYLIPLLYISFFGLNYINRWIRRHGGDVSDSLLITGTIFEITFVVTIIIMTTAIHRGMVLVQSANSEKLHIHVDPLLIRAVNSYMKGFNSLSSIKDLLSDPFIKDIYYSQHPISEQVITVQDMYKLLSQNRTKQAELIHYKIKDYRNVDDTTFEVRIAREFTGGFEDEIKYLIKNEGGDWKFDRIVRLFEGTIVHISEEERTFKLLQKDNKRITVTVPDPQNIEMHTPIKIWAVLETENRHSGEHSYVLYDWD